MTAQEWTFPVRPGTPARVDLRISFGIVRLVASEEPDVHVTVRPADASRAKDAELADSTRVDAVGGQVTIRAQHRGKLSSLFRPGAVEIVVRAPAESTVTADAGYAQLVAEGRWDHIRVHTSYGDVRVDQAQSLVVVTTGGTVAVGVVSGASSIRNTHGAIRVTDVLGRCELRNTHGDTAVVRSRGELEIRSAYGAVTVDTASAGSVSATTSYGSIDVGVATGTAVRLDAHTEQGTLSNALAPTGAPESTGDRLELTARSGWGAIVIRRSTRPPGGIS